MANFYQPYLGANPDDPFARDAEAVLADVLEEKVTPAHARDAYGVVIDAQTWGIDTAATQRLREGKGIPTK